MPAPPRLAIVLVVAAVALTGCEGGSASDDGPTGGGATLQEALRAHAEGDLGRAEQLYREVLAERPDDKYAHYNLGVIAQTREDPATAVTEYEAALKADPEFAPALFNLAIVLTDEGDTRTATQLYKRLIDVEPENASAHLNLGFLLIDRGREERGRHELEVAVQLDPSLEERLGAEAPTGATAAGATGASAG